MAVNLSGVGLNGTGIGTAREVPELTPASTTQDGGQSPTAPAAGEVNITTTAGLLANLEHALKARPAIDAGRVDSLGRAIAEGRYKVDSAKVASGLMQSERALAQLPRTQI